MKALLFIICITFLSYNVFAQTEFELNPYESMLMAGKGPGQDATINPFEGQDCYAIVENFGERQFSIRLQKDKTIIKEITILKGETKKVKLLKGYQLYLDPNPKGKARARVSYEKMEG